jgi:hypothetical protein
MGYWIFGIVVGVLLCGFLPIDTMTNFHNGLVKIVTLGKAKIKEKLKKE